MGGLTAFAPCRPNPDAVAQRADQGAGRLIPRTSHILLRQVKHQLHCLIREDVSEERIIQLAHRVERLHEHVRVGDFAGQKVMQCLLGTLIIACLDERLVSLSSARFSRNVRPKVADNVAALLDVSGRPTAALAVQKVRAATLDLEQRSVVNGRLVKLFGMLRNQFADHFEMAEFLDRDILEHVTDASILDVERLHPILQGGSQFAGGPSKLLKKIGNWAAGCQAWINALQGADGAYRRIDWNQRACFGF